MDEIDRVRYGKAGEPETEVARSEKLLTWATILPTLQPATT